MLLLLLPCLDPQWSQHSRLRWATTLILHILTYALVTLILLTVITIMTIITMTMSR
jgi:hypothetical protein